MSASDTILSLVVAVAENGIIGRDGTLPWHLPDDLRYFKRVTLGKPVVMGRKTFESIGKPLPGRPNVVLTRDSAWTAEGVSVTHSFEQALAVAAEQAGDSAEIMVIGGADLFAMALPRASRLYLTEVRLRPEGDVYFPPYDRGEWAEVERTPGQADPDGRHTHDFVVLHRRVA